MIGALGLEGVRAMMTVEGATDGEVFEAFVTHLLVPRLKPGDIVVLGNVGAHKPESALNRICAAGAHVMFLPPYSPDFNPIEHCWSKINALLRRFEALTPATLDAAIAKAVELVTPQDARGWFTHCGIRFNPSDRRYKYSLWCSSAGARMAAAIGSHGVAAHGGSTLPRPTVVVMAYTAHSDHSSDEPPTFLVDGDRDGLAPPSTMKRRVAALRRSGTDVEFRRYPNLGHGFGLGVGTSVEG
jgi:transposase